MKTLIFILALVLSVSAQTTLTVVGGSDSGLVRSNRMIDVFADENPEGMIFDRWEGDTFVMERSYEPFARVKTGWKQIELTAVYKNIESWSPSEPEPIGTTMMRYHFPKNPIGVVFQFHGTGGSLDVLFNRIERIYFSQELVDAGFAVVSLSSHDRVSRQWTPGFPEDNPDRDNVIAAIQSFIGRGMMTAQTPVFSSGVSNGGAFSARIALMLGFEGAAIFIAASSTPIANLTNSPTIWSFMEKDTILDPGSLTRARDSYNVLRNRGIDAEFHLQKPTRVYPRRFARIPGVSPKDSLIIHNALSNAGFIGADGFLTSNPTTPGWETTIPTRFNAFRNEIRDQLAISYAEHKFSSAHAKRVVRFFQRQAGAKVSGKQ